MMGWTRRGSARQDDAPTRSPASADWRYAQTQRVRRLGALNCDLDDSPTPKDMVSQSFTAMIKQRSSIMPDLFDLLYRKYCLARLAEMRKQLLLRTNTHEVPEANCDASHPDDAADCGDGLLVPQDKAGCSTARQKRRSE
jgi:hypothetical protein